MRGGGPQKIRGYGPKDVLPTLIPIEKPLDLLPDSLTKGVTKGVTKELRVASGRRQANGDGTVSTAELSKPGWEKGDVGLRVKGL